MIYKTVQSVLQGFHKDTEEDIQSKDENVTILLWTVKVRLLTTRPAVYVVACIT